MFQNEIKRFESAKMPENMPLTYWDVLLDLGRDADIVYGRILSVTRLLLEHSGQSWPSYEDWLGLMPDWITKHVPDMSAEEAEAWLGKWQQDNSIEIPWDFGSWIDALRERQWGWWGCDRNGRKMQIVLETLDLPPRIDAFKQILLAAGAKLDSEVWEPGLR